MTLGDRIHYLRTEKGYTLQELGDMVGVGPQMGNGLHQNTSYR